MPLVKKPIFFLKRSFFLKKNKKKGFYVRGFEVSRLRVPKKKEREEEKEKKKRKQKTKQKKTHSTMGRYDVIRCRSELEEFYPSLRRGPSGPPGLRTPYEQRGPPTCPILRTPYERFISDVNGALAAGASLIGGASVVFYKGSTYWTQAVMYP